MGGLRSARIWTVAFSRVEAAVALLGLVVGVLVPSDLASATPARRASVGDARVMRILQREPIEYDLLRISADEEASSVSHPLGAGGLSQNFVAEVDCRQHVVSIQSRNVFADLHLAGTLVFEGAEPLGWRAAPAGTTEGRLLTAACARADAPNLAQSAAKPLSDWVRSTPPLHGPGGIDWALQIASTPDAPGAQRELNEVERLLPELVHSASCVEPAEVGGHRTFRALILGVANGAQGRKLCQAVQATGRGCWVRAATCRPSLPGSRDVRSGTPRSPSIDSLGQER